MLRGSFVSTQDLIRLRGKSHGLTLPENPAVYRTGGFRSKILGRGMEYEKSRKYESGDDVRMIDWRVTARTGTAHTKVFQEDRQKAVYIIVDLTSSMKFGTRVAFKSVVACETSALLAWSAHSHGDVISIVGVSDDGVRHSKLASGAETLTQQLDTLSQISQSSSDVDSKSPLSDALAFVVKKIRTGDLAVVISDFSSLCDASQKSLEFLSRQQSLITCWVQDPTEQGALPVGHYPISDGAQYSMLHLSSGGRRRKMQNLLDQRNKSIESRLRRFGATSVRLTCGDEVIKVLHRTFHRRANLSRQNSWSVRSSFSRATARAYSSTG